MTQRMVGQHMEIGGGRVLVAERSRSVRRVVAAYLRRDGFQVLEASSGLEALLMLRRGTVDLALVDPMLPEIDGLELVRRVRRESTVPIIMLTASRDEAARIAALEAGADDYVIKPLSMREVTARMRAQLRRARGFRTQQTVLRTGELELDLDARRCSAGGREVDLTRREFDLLAALLRYPGTHPHPRAAAGAHLGHRCDQPQDGGRSCGGASAQARLRDHHHHPARPGLSARSLRIARIGAAARRRRCGRDRLSAARRSRASVMCAGAADPRFNLLHRS